MPAAWSVALTFVASRWRPDAGAPIGVHAVEMLTSGRAMRAAMKALSASWVLSAQSVKGDVDWNLRGRQRGGAGSRVDLGI